MTSQQINDEKTIFVIDVMNVVTWKHGSKKNYSFERLDNLLKELKSLGDNISYFAVIPRYLRTKIDKKDKYNKFLKQEAEKIIEFNPRKSISNDNYFIELAKKINGQIVTNDQLQDYPDERIKEKLLPFAFITNNGKEEIILPWKINYTREEQQV